MTERCTVHGIDWRKRETNVRLRVGLTLRRQELCGDPVYGTANAATYALYEALKEARIFQSGMSPFSEEMVALERKGNQIALGSWGIATGQMEHAHLIIGEVARLYNLQAMMTLGPAGFFIHGELQPLTRLNLYQKLGGHIVFIQSPTLQVG